ncbi:MAG TPA: Crp/Fnr family transcriptional regulator [Flavobacteriales bacterium]|nr:Crp/Fnr family transcriptional regulator [Flavobacteriales bacterium]
MAVSKLILNNFSLLQSLPDDLLENLGKQSNLVEVPRRKVVMEKNQTAHSLGLLVDGRLQGVDMTLDGREAGLYFIEPNDFFGELSVIDLQPATEFVISLTTSRFLMIPSITIRQLIEQSPQIATVINMRLARRLRESMQQRTLLTMPSPIQRVCAQLIQMTTGEQVVIYAPTHQEIAIMINTTRETVTRVFQKLQNSGIVAREGSSLHIKKLKHLTLLASGEKKEE